MWRCLQKHLARKGMDRSWSTPRPSHMNFKGPEHGPAGPAGRLERPLAGHAQIAPHCGCDGGVCDPSPTFATVGCEPSPFSECCSFDPFDCAVRHIARARPGLLGRWQTCASPRGGDLPSPLSSAQAAGAGSKAHVALLSTLTFVPDSFCSGPVDTTAVSDWESQGCKGGLEPNTTHPPATQTN